MNAKRKQRIMELLEHDDEQMIRDYCSDCMLIDLRLHDLAYSIHVYIKMLTDAINRNDSARSKIYDNHINRLKDMRQYIIEHDTDCIKHYEGVAIEPKIITPFDADD